MQKRKQLFQENYKIQLFAYLPCIELITCGELPLLAIDCKVALLGKLEGKLPSDNSTLAFATDTFGGD